MRVLMSIKPCFANAILSGEKRYEYRRRIFSDTSVNTMLIYATHPVSKVIGQVHIDAIMHDDLETIWRNTHEFGCIDHDSFIQYFTDLSEAYAIKLSDPRRYASGLRLCQLSNRITRPPQSFMYV
ncbi:phage associated protein [Bifidobacterium aquikefiri]|uniref:Phage associated protein n=1 Tax=Bifidobacterium aquikefiri TaxID=1653207 RepID=A0A261GAJ8_9BIFI|nr:phage associated protein [Bifidobacterium aquikefiri]